MLKGSSLCEFFEHISFRFLDANFIDCYVPLKNDGEEHIPSSHHPVKYEANWMMGSRAIIHAVHMVTMYAGFSTFVAKDQQLALVSCSYFPLDMAPQYLILTSVDRTILSYYLNFLQIMQPFCK